MQNNTKTTTQLSHIYTLQEIVRFRGPKREITSYPTHELVRFSEEYNRDTASSGSLTGANHPIHLQFSTFVETFGLLPT